MTPGTTVFEEQTMREQGKTICRTSMTMRARSCLNRGQRRSSGDIVMDVYPHGRIVIRRSAVISLT